MPWPQTLFVCCHSHSLLSSLTAHYAQDGNIFLAFENDGTGNHCLIRWASDGTNGQIVPTVLCSGALNGLSITSEDGQTFLYQTNKQQKISKTTLNGTLVWQHDGNFGQDPQLSYAPTGFATPPNSEYVYLCDGYGSDLVYPFTLTGQYANRSYGGRGTQKGKFMNNHGCSTDGRLVNTIVVSDRGNGRLQFFEYNPTSPNKFQYNASVDLRVALPSVLPSSVHTYPEHNGLAVVSDLDGRVVILNNTNHVVSVVEVAQLLAALGHKHPIDAILLPNGDLVVSTWSPGRVSYWKALG